MHTQSPLHFLAKYNESLNLYHISNSEFLLGRSANRIMDLMRYMYSPSFIIDGSTMYILENDAFNSRRGSGLAFVISTHKTVAEAESAARAKFNSIELGNMSNTVLKYTKPDDITFGHYFYDHDKCLTISEATCKDSWRHRCSCGAPSHDLCSERLRGHVSSYG